MRERWYDFLLASDIPVWQQWVRRLLLPIAVGTVLGFALFRAAVALGRTGGLVLILAVCLVGFVWAIRQLVWIRRIERDSQERIAAMRRAIDDA